MRAGSSSIAKLLMQRRYYDFNIRDYRQFIEKLQYIHHNPVKQGLCAAVCPR
jgi:hypothetical protein